MPLHACPHCAKQVRDQDPYCWSCGKPQAPGAPPKKAANASVAGPVALILCTLAFLLLVFSSGSDKPNPAAATPAAPPAAVVNSGWDGSVRQVERYVKRQLLRDPDSYQSVEWSKVQRQGEGYIVRHTFRAKNGFGGYEVATYGFVLDSLGNVVSAIPIK